MSLYHILQSLHESPLGEHSGIQNTYLRVRQLFHWPKLKANVRGFVLACDTCNRCKHENVAYTGLLQPLPIPDQAWSSVSMDFIEGLPKSERNDNILVVVDRFSKFAHFIGLAHPYIDQEVAKAYLDWVVALHEVPRTIVIDRDKIFTSVFWKEVMRSIGTKLNMSTTFHPQSDRQIEKVNQSLETYLRCVCILQPKGWHRWLVLAQWWYNFTRHTSLKMSPFEANYGYKPPILPTLEGHTTIASVEEYLQQRRLVLQKLKPKLASTQNMMK